eukprot:13260058-Heterocapsa_arctica.AAC.1
MPMRPSVTSSRCRSPIGANLAIRVANRLEARSRRANLRAEARKYIYSALREHRARHSTERHL